MECLEGVRTYKSIPAEYGFSKASISKECAEFSEKCQSQAIANPGNPNEAEIMRENQRLRKELDGIKKEILTLKSGGICIERAGIEAD